MKTIARFLLLLVVTPMMACGLLSAQIPSVSAAHNASAKYILPNLVLPADDDSLARALRFHANDGQLLDTDGNPVERVRFYSEQTYPAAYFMDDTLSYVFSRIDTNRNTPDTLQRVDMTFGGNGHNLYPTGQEAYFNNYYLGHIPEGRERVPFYKHLVAKQIWEKIDIVYSSNAKGLKYYIIVRAGGFPAAIHLNYNGQDGLLVDANGNLVIKTAYLGSIKQPRPRAYKMDGNGQLVVLPWQPSYQVNGDVVTLGNFGAYDQGANLVIEVIQGYVDKITATSPAWGTFHGDVVDEACLDMDIDRGDTVYVTGFTSSLGFPTQGSFVAPYGGSHDAYVGRFKPNYQMEWMTFYGGAQGDQAAGVTCDFATNRVYICGMTLSDLSFPVQAIGTGSYMDNFSSTLAEAGFVAAFDKFYGQRLWGTKFGGSGTACRAIETDGFGNVFVVGETWQANTVLSNQPTGGPFPICGPSGSYQQSVLNAYVGTQSSDGFVAKFNQQTGLVWSTLFGGFLYDGFNDLAIDHTLHMYVVGYSKSPNIGVSNCSPTSNYMPLCNAGGFFQDSLDGGQSFEKDGLITRFDLNGRLDWSSYFGGGDEDEITSVAVRYGTTSILPPTGPDIYIVGRTRSATYGPNGTVPQNGDFPHFATGPQYTQPYGGNLDAFVARFDYATRLQWCTYLGGVGEDNFAAGLCPGSKIAANTDGLKFVTGTSTSGSITANGLPYMPDPAFYDQQFHGDAGGGSLASDAYCFGFAENDAMIYGSYYGGVNHDYGQAIAMGHDRVYIGGSSDPGSNFPLFDPGSPAYFQGYPVLGSNGDAFYAQIQVSPFIVGIQAEEALVNGLVAYPNPVTEQTRLEWDTNADEEFTVTITNPLGQVVLQRQVPAMAGRNSLDLSLAALANGLYLVTVNSGQATFATKLVKE